MEVVYSAAKSSYDIGNEDLFPKGEGSALTLSCKNLAAFVASCNLHEKAVKNRDRVISKFQITYYIYVVDLDKPWELYLITSEDEGIQSLQFDMAGTRLLVSAKHGVCQVWRMKDYLINDWYLELSHCVKGEETVAAGWLHSGLTYNFLADKKDAVFYNDKYVRGRMAPSIARFGGGAEDGWIVVTATGLICVCTILSDNTLRTCTQSLGPTRSHIHVADISHHSNGTISVVTSDASINSAIQCYDVKLTYSGETLLVTCHKSYSLSARCQHDPAAKNNSLQILSVNFLTPETTDTIIVTCTGQNITFVEKWKLQEQTHAIHSSFSSESKYTCTKWTHEESIQYQSSAVAVCMPKLSINQSIPDITWHLIQYIGLAFRDRSVKLINKQTFSFMNSLTMDTVVYGKSNRQLPDLVALTQSQTGCGMLGLDSYGALVLFRPLNVREPGQQIPPVYVVSLLEYSMVSGFDTWDVALLLKSGTVEPVLQRLTDNFHKQSISVQEYLYTRFMGLKAALYRCSQNNHQKISECLSKLLLNSVATTFKSIFRPTNLHTQDKSPADKLTIACNKLVECDLDKFIISLEAKEYIVESGTLQSLQQLIQWVADFTLCLLSLLPIYQNYSSFAGSGIIRDVSSLATLRELLVIIRMWGLLYPASLPILSTSNAGYDALAVMFKTLSKVWISVKDGNTDFDETLLDDCLTLKSQIYMPKLEQVMMRDGSHYPFSQSTDTVTFSYMKEPGLTEVVSFSSMLDGQVSLVQYRDFVHQVNIGNVESEKMRECCRCGNVSLLKVSSRSAASKAWDQRWSRACLCGGQWKRCQS